MSYFSDRPMCIDLSADYCCATIQGPDASTFLQSQFACDVTAIAPQTAQWTCWADARGKVRALGHLAQIDGDHWRFIAARSFAPALRKLAMFILRSRVSLTLSDGVWGGLGQPTPPGGARIDADRSLRIAAPESTAHADLSLWRSIAAIRGEAQLGAEICAEEIPQSLGLSPERGLSLSKGCYPGQEIISRVHYRGRPPRKLVTTIAKKAPEDALFAIAAGDSGMVVAQSLRAWVA